MRERSVVGQHRREVLGDRRPHGERRIGVDLGGDRARQPALDQQGTHGQGRRVSLVARDRQQVLDEPVQPLGLLLDGLDDLEAHRTRDLAARLAQDLRAQVDGRDRGSQLVRQDLDDPQRLGRDRATSHAGRAPPCRSAVAGAQGAGRRRARAGHGPPRTRCRCSIVGLRPFVLATAVPPVRDGPAGAALGGRVCVTGLSVRTGIAGRSPRTVAAVAAACRVAESGLRPFDRRCAPVTAR